MHDVRAKQLQSFVEWVGTHVHGDEKGEAQLFLDRLLQAFGHGGVKEAGATLEMRIKSRDRKGTAFADLVWKPYVLIEMKKRGEDLTRHYRQAFDYWTHLVPGRPRYVILCNFDELWVYDFETQMDEPVDTVPLAELPQRYDPLVFLFPQHEAPRFGNHHEKVTRDAADRLAACFNKLMVRNVPRAEAQHFILQFLVALFAEDIQLLPHSLVLNTLADCQQPRDTYDLLGSLFEAMNTPGGVAGGRFKGVEYFNGGLFARPARLELQPDEVAQLETAAKFDWSKVRPEIFGTIFEHSLGAQERHAYGCHFTHPTDIMKIVGPTIVRPWTELIENARSLQELEELRQRLQDYTVLDPACGAGNFLYLAYRELKRLEVRLFERIGEKKRTEKGQRQIGFVTARQFYGIDINPFACEIAKVTMMLARKLAIDELKSDEQPLPLDNLDGNFLAGDALIEPLTSNGRLVHVTLFDEFDASPFAAGKVVPTKWPRADVIIGNPPFLGAKLLKPERGADYVNAVRKVYPDVPGMADYCVYWLRKAHEHLPVCVPERPEAGRAGLVGTQNVRNNQSRVGGLDHIVKTGTIVEAVDNQPWSGEANVHVSIVNWVKHGGAAQRSATTKPGTAAPDKSKKRRGATTKDVSAASAPPVDETQLLIPAQRRLWYRVPAKPKTPLFDPDQPGNGNGNGDERSQRKDKMYDLEYRECPRISSSLSDGADTSAALELACNVRPKRVFQGVTPGHAAFVLKPVERKELGRCRGSLKVIFPYLVGRELLTGAGNPERFLIDFGQKTVLECQQYPAAFERIKKYVLPDRMKNAESDRRRFGAVRSHHQQFLEHWWKLAWDRADMVQQIRKLARRYIVCSRVTKRPVFVFVGKGIRPGDALQVFVFDDDYSFGILQSAAHWQWFTTKCSKLTERYRYTPESVFDTFPWPQAPCKKQVNAVAVAGRAVRRIRAQTLPQITGGLRALYRTLELPGKNPLRDAHAALDAAVLDAYGFSPKADLLGQLLALNQQVAARIERGEPVTAPGVPASYGDARGLVTDDCIEP